MVGRDAWVYDDTCRSVSCVYGWVCAKYQAFVGAFVFCVVPHAALLFCVGILGL